MDVYIGFDSAWANNPKAPGAICAVGLAVDGPAWFLSPRLASFEQALAFIKEIQSTDGPTIIALDQPTVVPNTTGMRPVERTAASLISWLGGGVQPANRGKVGMFCDASPIWPFLTALGAVEDPERARSASAGLHLMEVFPALALASLDTGFFGRLRAPRYNPARKATFKAGDWLRVSQVAENEARALGCEDVAAWCQASGRIAAPRKADQDMLDSVLCLLIAIRWRIRPRKTSLLLGDVDAGYMVVPTSAQVRDYLIIAARKYEVPIDGKILSP